MTDREWRRELRVRKKLLIKANNLSQYPRVLTNDIDVLVAKAICDEHGTPEYYVDIDTGEFIIRDDEIPFTLEAGYLCTMDDLASAYGDREDLA
jgi:hypothetical protein